MTEDMTKKIVMGPYYKYHEEDNWFSERGNVGEVRVIEDVLCYAVLDIEYYDEQRYDLAKQEYKDSQKVIRWEPYDCTQ